MIDIGSPKLYRRSNPKKITAKFKDSKDTAWTIIGLLSNGIGSVECTGDEAPTTIMFKLKGCEIKHVGRLFFLGGIG